MQTEEMRNKAMHEYDLGCACVESGNHKEAVAHFITAGKLGDWEAVGPLLNILELPSYDLDFDSCLSIIKDFANMGNPFALITKEY